MMHQYMTIKKQDAASVNVLKNEDAADFKKNQDAAPELEFKKLGWCTSKCP